MEKNKFGERVKERRIALGMSQDELAKKLGYASRSTINKIENGTNDVVQTKVAEFARALDTSISYLMAWDERPGITYGELFPDLNDAEKDLIKAFRKSDSLTKQMVLRLLNIEQMKKENTETA